MTDFIDGYPSSYNCDANVTYDTYAPIPRVPAIVNSLTVEYDYEILVDNSTYQSTQGFLEQDLPGLEWGLLWTVSYGMGLVDCQLERLDPSTYRQDGRGLQTVRGTFVIGASSLPKDSVDSSVASCEHLVTESGSRCLPMLGEMEVFYVGDDRKAVENYVASKIENDLNDQRSLVTPVQKTLYLGDRNSFVEPRATNTSAVDDSSGPSTGAVAASITSAAALLVVLAILLVRCRRSHEASATNRDDTAKNSTRKEATKRGDFPSLAEALTAKSEDEILLESSFDSVRPDESEVASEQPQNILKTASPAPVPYGSADQEVASTPEAKATEDHHVQNDDSDLESEQETSSTLPPMPPNAEKTSLEQDKVQVIGELENVVDFLPPLPPGACKGQAPQATKNRRRMKKKKKGTFVRTNSRESVNEMIVIPEGNKDSDDESEYSWTSDENSSGKQSRDPSPTRSQASADSEDNGPSEF
jgi:hypothetical protein